MVRGGGGGGGVYVVWCVVWCFMQLFMCFLTLQPMIHREAIVLVGYCIIMRVLVYICLRIKTGKV